MSVKSHCIQLLSMTKWDHENWLYMRIVYFYYSRINIEHWIHGFLLSLSLICECLAVGTWMNEGRLSEIRNIRLEVNSPVWFQYVLQSEPFSSWCFLESSTDWNLLGDIQYFGGCKHKTNSIFCSVMSIANWIQEVFLIYKFASV